jgi:hypothetical protein
MKPGTKLEVRNYLTGLLKRVGAATPLEKSR